MFRTHIKCDTTLAATRDEALGNGCLDLLLLQFEHLVAQRCCALVRHHATTTTAAITRQAMVFELDQLKAQAASTRRAAASSSPRRTIWQGQRKVAVSPILFTRI